MKKMKRALSIAIALAMVIACIPFSTVAAAEQDAAQESSINITIDGVPYDNVLIREVKWKNSSYRLCENFAGTELSSSLTTKDIFSVKVIGNIYEGVKDGLS